jgi:glutamyl-tRNA synthetase
MQISHVIRAEEHLSNTPRQVFIALSLGYQLPQYAHLPFVAEPGSRNKLSKRKLAKYLKNGDFSKLLKHGQRIADSTGLETDADGFNPVIVDFYRQVGYLPHAIINYLALLGWSLDDKTEHFTRQQLVESFSLDRVNKAPASFDPQKLFSFQEYHMLELPADEKLEMTLPYLQRANLVPTPASEQARQTTAQILAAAGDRIKVAGDVLDYADFFTPDDQLPYDEKAFQKRLRKPEDAAQILAKFKDQLAQAEPFDAETLDKLLHEFVESEEIKMGQIIHALRVSVTGKAVGFGMFDILAIVGKESCVARIERALGQI